MVDVAYSVVIPVKDEEENIEPLISEIQKVLESLQKPYEVIVVDDGSKDQTRHILNRLKKELPFLKTIFFRQNYGQTSAFDAGFKAAKAPLIITLDGDGQNDPKDIPKMLALMQEADLVCGWRQKRKDTLSKKLISKIVNPIRSRLCQDNVHDTGCSLKIYRKSCLEKIRLYHGMHRFLPALFIIEGFKVKEIPVSHRERTKGKSKYHFFNRSLAPFLDLFAVVWMRRRKLCYEIEQGL